MNFRKTCPRCGGELEVTQIESKRMTVIHLHCKCGFSKRVKFPAVKPVRLTVLRKAIG